MLTFIYHASVISFVGHNKKQQAHRAMDEVPQGEGTCSFCHKKVQSLKDHILDQHKEEI